MLKWQDPLSNQMDEKLKMLARDLRAIKPRGWSVIFSKNEVIARPENRTIGKFSITLVMEHFSVAFFSRELNYWNKWENFEVNDSAAAKVKEWMESEVIDPLKRSVRSLDVLND
jgi:hypothetical protein